MRKASHNQVIHLLIPVMIMLLIGACTSPGKPVRLRDSSQVDRVLLTEGMDSVQLLKTEEGWTFRDGEQLNDRVVEDLLFSAARLQISSIVSKAPPGPVDQRNISYYRGRRLLLSYTLGKESDRYILHPPGEQSYYVTLPGYPDLNLMRIFSVEANHYRERLLIALLPTEIASIGMELASGEAFQFSQDADGSVRCEAANALTILPGPEPNDLAARLLFSYFTSIMHEGKSGTLAETLYSPEFIKEKMATIRLRSFAGETHIFQVFPYREKSGSKPHMFRALVLHNQEPEAYIVNYIYLDVLMRGLEHYFAP